MSTSPRKSHARNNSKAFIHQGVSEADNNWNHHTQNGRTSPHKPKPLQISKTKTAQQDSLQDLQYQSSKTIHPPRDSSLRNRHPIDSETFHESRARLAVLVEAPNSTKSDYPEIFTTFGEDLLSPDPATSRPSEQNPSTEQYLSDPKTSGLFGDFIPIVKEKPETLRPLTYVPPSPRGSKSIK